MNGYNIIFMVLYKYLRTYFPQIITVCGTLLGTTLGWFLKYLQDNVGGTEFCVEEVEMFKDENNNIGYNIKVFVCNHSLKSKYIKEITLCFNEKKSSKYKDTPKIDSKKDYFVKNKSHYSVVNLKYNEPNVFFLCNIIEYKDIQGCDNVVICYKNEKGNLKNINVNYSLSDIKKYPHGALFPN